MVGWIDSYNKLYSYIVNGWIDSLIVMAKLISVYACVHVDDIGFMDVVCVLYTCTCRWLYYTVYCVHC